LKEVEIVKNPTKVIIKLRGVKGRSKNINKSSDNKAEINK